MAYAIIAAAVLVALSNPVYFFLICCAVWVALYKLKSQKLSALIVWAALAAIAYVWIRATLHIFPLWESRADNSVAQAIGVSLGYALGLSVLAASLWAASFLGVKNARRRVALEPPEDDPAR